MNKILKLFTITKHQPKSKNLGNHFSILVWYTKDKKTASTKFISTTRFFQEHGSLVPETMYPIKCLVSLTKIHFNYLHFQTKNNRLLNWASYKRESFIIYFLDSMEQTRANLTTSSDFCSSDTEIHIGKIRPHKI